MSKVRLTSTQKRHLWSVLVKASQGEFGTLYDGDHEYDEEFESYIKAVENILSNDSLELLANMLHGFLETDGDLPDKRVEKTLQLVKETSADSDPKS